MFVWLVYGVLGAVVGVLGGLLGLGGGLIIVPSLWGLFACQGFPPDQIQHMAVGTSLATIVFTSISSMKAHHERKSVSWPIVRRMAPAIVAGTLAGAWVASRMGTRFLQWLFVVFLFAVASQMFMKAHVHPSARESRHTVAMSFAGGLIGLISSMVGIGGGSMIVPFLSWCNVAMRTAIGTSSAIGLFIALSGAFGSAVFGGGHPSMPAHSLGSIYLPATVGIAAASVLTAPLGARLAHHLPVPILKRVFAVLILAIGTKLLWGLIR